jgi:hypothetical protein
MAERETEPKRKATGCISEEAGTLFREERGKFRE